MKASKPMQSRVAWQDLRTRLSAAIGAAAGAKDLTPDQGLALMRSRAKALAAAANAGAAREETIEAIFFELGPAAYAIQPRYVCEIRKPGPICRLAGTPGFILGITPLRGEMLAVVDLRPLLGLPEGAAGQGGRLIVLGEATPEFAVIADGAEGTAMLHKSDLVEPTDRDAGPGRRWASGVTPEGRVLLDGAALLADDRLFVGPEVGQAEP